MAKPSPREELPEHALIAASLAARLLEDFVADGGTPGNLFTAFVGMVSARDQILGGQCLLALEEVALTMRENGRR